MTDDIQDGILSSWVDELRTALEIEADLDISAVLGLAGVAAHAVVRPAAPLTTYLVGFAVGRATAYGADPTEAAATATQIARELARSR
jgi:hypothetical protein